MNQDRAEAPDSSGEAGASNPESQRERKRLGLFLDLTGASPAASICGRAVVLADKEALAELMLDAYRDTVDYDNETLADAISEVEHTLSGSYGRFLLDCSFLVAGEGGLASATLVTLPDNAKPCECPLLAFAITRKRDQRRGLASALILRSAAAVRAQGCRRLALAVTVTNEPARRLYDRLGFRPAEQEEAGKDPGPAPPADGSVRRQP
jgi:GNAT superfamily N-acetyltransferase